jgi:hypothetical protein
MTALNFMDDPRYFPPYNGKVICGRYVTPYECDPRYDINGNFNFTFKGITYHTQAALDAAHAQVSLDQASFANNMIKAGLTFDVFYFIFNIILFIIGCLLIIGWCMNIYKLVKGANDPTVTPMTALRVVGIFVPFWGGIIGWQNDKPNERDEMAVRNSINRSKIRKRIMDNEKIEPLI